MRSILLAVTIVAIAELPNPPKAPACAAAPRRGESFDVNSEEAIIFYDAKTKTEHFIRRANFRTEATDFGFLVPTPTKPELGEIQSSIFQTLNSATAPRQVPSGNVKRIVQKRTFGDVASKAISPPSSAPVILDRKQVAGYDAVVLQAGDAEGLKVWLEANKYDARPELMAWVKWYVENKWIITAFKIIQEPRSSHDRWAKSVRMTFQTDKPFYPYREPADMRSQASTSGRKLRVFFLSDARYSGMIGKEGNWPARTEWANILPEPTLNTVVVGLNMPVLDASSLNKQKWHLTEFVDLSSPRPGTDEVYFTKSEDQRRVERPVIYYDRFEYVYEDEKPTILGAKAEPAILDVKDDEPAILEADGSRMWLILGGVVALGAVFLGIGFLILLKKAPRGH